MSSTIHSAGFAKTGASSGVAAAEAIAGAIAIVLTILGLAHVESDLLVAIATIAIGVALLAQGTAIAGEYAYLTTTQSNAAIFGGSSTWSIELLTGAAGIVLGILALLGVVSLDLIAIAVIAFGGGLALSSGAAAQIAISRSGALSPDDHTRRFAIESASTGSITQGLTGLQAVVLGILALAGFSPLTLVLIALLVTGVFTLVNGSTFGAFILSFFRR